MKLGMWQRLGIVLSALWMTGATYLGDEAKLAGADRMASGMVKLCKEAERGNLNERCELQYSDTYKTWSEHALRDAAISAAVPIPFAWATAFAAVWAVRWIWRGRKISN